MTPQRCKNLGDPHNFNRRVYLLNGTIFKPRCCTIEKTILGQDFRDLLDSFFDKIRLNSPLSYLPIVQYKQISDYEYKVDYVTTVERNEEPISVNWSQIGSMCGLLLWLGADDIHNENIKLVSTLKGLCILPLDLETIFKELPLLSATHLLPHAGKFQDIFGLSCISLKGARTSDLCKLIDGFSKTIILLNQNSKALTEYLIENLTFNAHFRIILRETRSYYAHMNGLSNELELLPEEEEQIKRGDIPYFFTKAGSKILMYFKDEKFTPSEVGSTPLTEKKVSFMESFGFERNVDSIVIKNSVAQIIKWFAPILTNDKTTTDILGFKDNLIVVNLDGMDKFACPI